MSRPERFSNIQALAWLNAITEDDSGNESEGENICESLDQEVGKFRPRSAYMGSDFLKWIGFRD